MTRHAPTLLALFFGLATLICLATALTLFLPDTPISVIWRVKPTEYARLLAMGPVAAWGFLALSGVMAGAAFGTFRRRRWGWWLAMAIFTANALGDAARLPTPDWVEGLTGIFAVSLVLVLMTRPAVKGQFVTGA